MQAAPRTLQVQERLHSSRQLLAELLHSEALTNGDIDAAYRQVTELAVQLLDVERASVWRFDPMRMALTCSDLYERSTHAHSSGQVIVAKDVPRYFEALSEERCLVAHDAHADPRTCAFSESYLRPLGIGAMLDAPIWVGGHMVGVVCHEHVGGERHFELTEELLAGTVADFVARVVEAADRLRAERVLGQYRQHVQELMGLRSQQRDQLNVVLQREVAEWHAADSAHSEPEETQRVLDASPVPVVITRLHDAEVRYVNGRAAELFENDAAAMVGKRAPDFYVDAANRRAFLEELRSSNRVDGFVAKLRTRKGREFWALMSAVRIPFQGDECFMVGFSDVTAQKVAEDAIRQGAQSLRALFAAAPVALILSRISDQTVVLANQRAADLFEVPLEQVVGEKTPDYYIDRAQRDRIVQELVRDGYAEDTATHLRTRSGKEFWGSLSARLVAFEDQPCFLTGVSDVTPQKQLEAQLRELATRDALTGVWNRRHFAELAQHELQRIARSGQPLAMLRLDADHFKKVNDEHGHAAGDRVLVAIARATESVMRTSDVLARVGGEEFDVLLPDTDAQGAAQLAERIRSAIAAVVITTDRGERISPRVSVGVAAHREGDDFESILRRADDALYRAKQAGRDRTVVS